MDLKELHTPEIGEMKKFFEERTNNHINRVKKYAQKISDKFPELSGVVEQAKNHDSSKYESPEYESYLYITWSYKCKDDGKDFKIPDEIDDNAATLHHIKNNRHHPEFHDEGSNDKSLNRNDRDAVPERATDGTKMTNIDIAEMVSDWLAMSEEKGTSIKDWADKNINKRWNFTDDQVDLIYKLIDNIKIDDGKE